MTSAEYYDIEDIPDEIKMAVAIKDMCLIAYVVGVRPMDLFVAGAGCETKRISPEQFQAIFKNEAGQSAESLEAFGNSVGYSVKNFVGDKFDFYNWNVDHLVAVTQRLGLNWLQILPQ